MVESTNLGGICAIWNFLVGSHPQIFLLSVSYFLLLDLQTMWGSPVWTSICDITMQVTLFACTYMLIYVQ